MISQNRPKSSKKGVALAFPWIIKLGIPGEGGTPNDFKWQGLDPLRFNILNFGKSGPFHIPFPEKVPLSHTSSLKKGPLSHT